MSVLKGSRIAYVFTAAVFIALGVFMCAWPLVTVGVLCAIAGAALLAGGVWQLVKYFRAGDYSLLHRWDFAAGALEAVLGLLVIRHPNAIVEMIPFVLGVMVLVNSVFQLQLSMELRKLGYPAWWYHLAAALVCALIAAFMMFNPFRSYELLSVFIGVAFIIDGLADLWTALYVTRRLKKMNLI